MRAKILNLLRRAFGRSVVFGPYSRIEDRRIGSVSFSLKTEVRSVPTRQTQTQEMQP